MKFRSFLELGAHSLNSSTNFTLMKLSKVIDYKLGREILTIYDELVILMFL